MFETIFVCYFHKLIICDKKDDLMKVIKKIFMTVLAVFFVYAGIGQTELLITSDFDSIRNCKTYDEMMQIAGTMISARPDVLAMDAATPDFCNFKSSIERYETESNWGDDLYKAGFDPYGEMVKKLTGAGISVVANIRMNDHHGNIYMWTPWAQEHREWSLGYDVGDRGWRAIGQLRRMDYAFEGVREHRLAIIKEIIDKYDIDGIQLDFQRSSPFLSEPRREKAKYMTQYIRDIRKVLDDAERVKQHPMYLGALLPWDITFCKEQGLEVDKWIREGLLSYVCPGEWHYLELNIPLEKWIELTKDTACKLYGYSPGDVSPSYYSWDKAEKTLLGDNRLLDGPKIRALAETAYHQGAEGIMLYNFYSGVFGNFYPYLRDWINPVNIPSMTRHYFFCRRLKYVPTQHYTFGDDNYTPDEVSGFTRFPLDKIGDEVTYKFLFGSDLKNSTARLSFKMMNALNDDEISVTINGTTITSGTIHYLQYVPREGTAYQVGIWESPLSSPPLILGENEIFVKLLMNDPDRQKAIETGEFEIFVEPDAR